MLHPFRSIPGRLALIGFSLFLLASMISRMALLITARHEITWDMSVTGAFATGLAFDAAAALFAAIPWWLAGVLLPSRFWSSRLGKPLLMAGFTVFIALLVFITTAEWFFWDEFGARFNFIAVDYLVWTQEVMGNINESYPMKPILAAIAAMACAATWIMHRFGGFRFAVGGGSSAKDRLFWALAGTALPALATGLVNQASMPGFTNQYHAEIAKNGCWSFLAAFRQMELEYEKWYPTLPKDECLAAARGLLANKDAPMATDRTDDLRRSIAGTGHENRWNVILVCMESMSGSYMSYLGGKPTLTPNLNRLAGESVFFDNLFATGTRTVRGMEAITLSLPPTPGQSILYRPEGTNLTTSFTPFLDRGYDCAFFYGGDGRFDFMNRFYSTAGCRIMDVNAWKKEDVTMKTSWGACDEDLFQKTISEADADYAAGKPFHYFCMTTSNHRPYDFPDGRIDMKPHGRKPAVKYADWAVGHLIEEARKRPWFDNTLFVIVSDHCASSAGKAELDVTKYHIPALLYNPKLVPARRISKLCSQIDVMPTVLGLLGWNHLTLGYGNDQLAESAATLPGRAFVSNYQKIALLRDEGITILKPNRQPATHAYDPSTGALSPIDPVKAAPLVRDTTIFYQSASWLFRSGGLKQAAAGAPITLR